LKKKYIDNPICVRAHNQLMRVFRQSIRYFIYSRQKNILNNDNINGILLKNKNYSHLELYKKLVSNNATQRDIKTQLNIISMRLFINDHHCDENVS
jgi:hypothetical protein